MSKAKVFQVLAVGFIGGIFWRSFFGAHPFLEMTVAVGALGMLAVFYRSRKIALIAMVALFFVLGSRLTERRFEWATGGPAEAENFSGQVLVITEPVAKEYRSEFFAQTEAGEKILIGLPPHSDIRYGDNLSVNCSLQRPENKTEDFDYQMYLAKEGVLRICQQAEARLIRRNSGNGAYSFIMKLKKNMEANIRTAVPAPEASLGIGVILGGSSDMTTELKEKFSRTGMTHIVAVSGYNVTVIAEYLMLAGIFCGLWRQQAFWLAIFGILTFVVMTGMQPSAVRAGLMGSLLLWAMKNGRLANAQNAILCAGAIMLFSEPLLLRYDIGFQLSFLATLGIVYLYPIFESRLPEKSRTFFLWEILGLSLAAQISVMPILMYNFHRISIVSLLANLLILPVVPFSMLLVFLVGISGWIAVPLSIFFAWFAYLALGYEVRVVEFLAGLSWSAVEVGKFSAAWILLWYGALGTLIWSERRKKKLMGNDGK